MAATAMTSSFSNSMQTLKCTRPKNRDASDQFVTLVPIKMSQLPSLQSHLRIEPCLLTSKWRASAQASDRGGARRGKRVGGRGGANEVLYDRQTSKSTGFATFLTMSCVKDYNAVIENLDERVFEAVSDLQDIENNF
nr:28 kDa ribonucleoprotein, chloroplastic-like [Ipomoea trifida]